uniref:PRKR-like endoplasmic reticulum kinase n=1 Tax=Syphacia muris TaxID=451379 RepID=A0A158R5Y8_9BILA
MSLYKVLGATALAGLLIFAVTSFSQATNAADTILEHQVCSSFNNIIVSTMDGKITALDVNGNVLWSLNVDDEPLLSGTFSAHQKMFAGELPYTIVPSLDGSLFMLEIKRSLLRPVPLTADISRVINDVAITGGSVNTKTGIDPITGEYVQVKYRCTSGKFPTTMSSQTLVLTRNTQTARAADPLTGLEKFATIIFYYNLLLTRNVTMSFFIYSIFYRFFEDFTPIRCLGRGGYGVVFNCKHKLDDRNYAVKRITVSNTASAIERVTREAKAMAKLNHPGIIRYFHTWIEKPPAEWQQTKDKEILEQLGIFSEKSFSNIWSERKTKSLDESSGSWMVSENVAVSNSTTSSSESENALSEPKPLSLSKSIFFCHYLIYHEVSKMRFWFKQLVCAVDYIHEQGLIHRDIKPQNIFFSADCQNTLKIGDLGLATNLETEESSSSVHALSTRRHTGNVGTRLYMSPEQLKGKAYNQKVDVFSLGLIFTEMLIPFQTVMERHEVLTTLQSGTLPPQYLSNLPEERNFIHWLTAEDPACRPSSAEVMHCSYLKENKQMKTD